MLSPEMGPLMAVAPYGMGKMVGNLTNLNMSQGSLLVRKNSANSGLSVFVKFGPSGNKPDDMFAGIIANRFPIADVLMQSIGEEAEFEAVPTTASLSVSPVVKAGSKRKQFLCRRDIVESREDVRGNE